MTTNEALRQAAERVLDAWDYPQGMPELHRRMRALRAALVEPQAIDTSGQRAEELQELEHEAKAAIKTLEILGYTYHGAELWKPPLSESAQPHFEDWCKEQFEWKNWYYTGEGPAAMAVPFAKKAFEAGQAMAQRLSQPASKPWVGLTTADLDEIDAPIRERGSATIVEIYRAIEAKLREKNGGAA